ncbi:hypothetical protein ILUMI_21749 [Ignelater luminosus]|uniref:Uncharacterized protein n=1 Tax=Ignelater luminosus TaxID=2038154 RepID=A0A8K0CID2_IGNLU|nr:hypothetical protein ILUMI_21749 [Ignelater luminosus]
MKDKEPTKRITKQEPVGKRSIERPKLRYMDQTEWRYESISSVDVENSDLGRIPGSVRRPDRGTPDVVDGLPSRLSRRPGTQETICENIPVEPFEL